ncbi:EAL domain-containing protein [Idiomarina aminovorans]|uniref:EAL domain-containing protein n=1 Tax=Idiomarina aminovorans TaxID=2914829 RepID=UPI002004BC2D|nr:EAL domain-containing protein [Idiomarina sp. ATCH4]MCK7458191.1 EAL domain-containing protein [Idiomarina sp. ATCH4]
MLSIYSPNVDAQEPFKASQTKQWSFADGLPSNHIHDITEGPNGFLWIATASGLSRFDGTQFYNYPITSEADSQLLSNSIHQLFFSQSEKLWFSTGKSLAKLSLSSGDMSTFNLPEAGSENKAGIKHISEDSSGRLLVTTDRFVFRSDPLASKFERLELTYNDVPITKVNYIFRGKNWYWLSTEEDGVFVWDGFSREVFALNKQNPITDNIPGSQLYAALNYQQQLWLTTDQGVIILDRDFRLVPTPDAVSELDNIADIQITEDNDILFSTASGLYQLSGNQLNKLHNFPVNRTQQIARGDIFSITKNQGILQIETPFAPAALKLLKENNSNTIAINTPKLMQQVSAAIEGSNGNWWLATELGLLFYDTQQEEISELNHYPEVNVQVNKMRLFANRLYIVSDSGEFYQYDIIDKSWNKLNIPTLSTKLVDFNLTRHGHSLWLHNNEYALEINEFGEVSEKKPIRKDPSFFTNPVHIDTKKISDTTYLFNFTAPFAIAPNQLVYRYKTDNTQDDWQLLDAGYNSVQLPSMPTGQRKLEVQVSYDNERWSPSTFKSFNITTPFWQSPIAWAGYIFIIFALTASYWRYQQRRRTASQQKLQQLQRQTQGLQSSQYQCWEWDLSSGELVRQNIWKNGPAFPIDGKRVGFSGGKSNVHPEDLQRLQKSLAEHLQGQSDLFECSYRLDNRGSWLWILDRGKLQANGENHVMFGTLSDISSLVSSEERINMLAASITNISDGICIFDRFFRKREVNNAFESISGFQREQVLGQLLTLSCYPDSFVNQIKRAVIKDGTWRGEISDVKADGDEFLMELTLDAVRDDNGEVSLIVASFSDITERRHTENEMRRLSNTDTLTGLPNRSYFQVSHSNLVRKKVSHTLLLFDLDDFKKINDSLGHEIGDELLCQVAERLMDIGRRQDTLYRLGGDEFGLLIEDSVDINLIGDLGNQVNLKVSDPYLIQQHEIVIGSSIGIVLYPHDGQTSQELLQKADMAMYHAKQRGGNCYQFFSQSMNENAVKRLKLENQLRSALKTNNIRVHYQPKIEMSSGHIAGLEALVRIENSDGSMISPADFIPLAEETGLIIPLGEEVLRQSCRDMRQFMTAPGAPKSVAINLSARQFMQSSLALQIEQILREEGLHARHVEFEITEGMVMSDPERAITMMENLSDMGVKLALDDFGTGYSSLSYLKRFPMNSLKVDKAFVDDITINDKDRNMVASIIAMAHNLGLKVVAEGVETKAQLQTLKSLKCEYIQGFYYAKPMPANALIEFIEQHNEVAAQV